MKNQSQEPESQLNMEEPEAEEYSLEEIMREFGGWSKPEPESEPESEPEPALEPETELEPEPEQIMRIAAEQDAPRSRKPLDLSGDTVRFQPVRKEDLQEEPEPPRADRPVEMPEEPEPDPRRQRAERQAQKRETQRLRQQEKERRRAERAAKRAARQEEPEVVYPSPAEACAAYSRVGTLRLRLMLSTVLTLASAALLLLSQYTVGSLDWTGHLRGFSIAMLALLLLQSLISPDVFVRGVYQALRLKFDLLTLVSLAAVVSAADAFFAVAQERAPFCTSSALALLLALWSISLEKTAKRRTLKTVLSMDVPVAAVKEEKAWHGLDCVFRQEGNLDDFTAMLETPDAAQKAMRVYAPLAAVGTACLAAFAALRSGSNFLWAWSALLTAALPAGGCLACYRPFAILSRRLHRSGAAICGWRGAKILSGECGLVIQDNDLFPKASISMNGMKMYSDMPIRQVVGYATAVVQAAGSGLLPLFEELMKNENGRRYTADSFRQYEGGGLGAEIRGDVVLLGSLPFMRLMGVHVPEGTKVQSAVYISVNKELTGVFALTYAPSAAAKSGLQSVTHCPGLTPILATRDFMITPALVKKRYKVSTDRLEFPVVAERARLSAPEAGAQGRQGALMARDSFASFAAAVTGGRLLRRTVHSAVLVSLLSGVLGMVLLCILTYLDATEAASAVNLLVYQLLWQLPVWMITGLLGKS